MQRQPWRQILPLPREKLILELLDMQIAMYMSNRKLSCFVKTRTSAWTNKGRGGTCPDLSDVNPQSAAALCRP